MAIFFPRGSNRLRQLSGRRKPRLLAEEPQASKRPSLRSTQPVRNRPLPTPDLSRSPRLRRIDRWHQATPESHASPEPPRLQPIAPRLEADPLDQSTVQVSRFRLILVWAILLLSGLGLALNLLRLQVIQAPQLQEQARQQQQVSLRPFVPRRPIVDRMGNVVAIDRPAFTLYAHPVLFRQSQQAIAAELSPILGETVGTLMQKFNAGDSGIEVEYALSEDVADRISNLALDGLELIEHPQRLYPQRDLFASIVGYVNTDRQGQAGLEYGQQDMLKRPAQTLELNRAGDGSIIPSGIPRGFLHQDDLRMQLTLDSRIQRAARFALHQKVTEYGAKRGAVLVMDVQDGSLLAMVTEPSYDPNQYYNFDLERFRNWTLSDPYEPGSTFKPINVAIALETGTVRPDDVFYDEGQIQVGGWPIQNNDYTSNGGRGSLTVTEILQYSSNVGMVHVMQQVQPEVYYEWMERLGLGRSIGTDLPFETAGQIKSREQFTGAAIEPATTAFGQGFTLTPIQLLQLHAMLANNGRMVTPHVVRGLVDDQGVSQWQPDLPEPRQTISPQVAQTVLGMMEAVVQDGTGKVAQIPGYRIAGKTGTAQKASPYGGYSNARITSFVSSFPVENPRYTVLVVVDEPQGDNAFGSTVAAPVAKSVMEALISIEHIAPSQPIAPIPVDEAE